ncbi:MAG: aldehyde dehydrogenase family protein [Anaeroplasmataceae bacterium]
MEIKKMYINGAWCEGEKTFDAVNPFDASLICKVYESSIEDTNEAIKAAKYSFYKDRTWRDMDSQTRGDWLLKIADEIDACRDEFARLETIDNGKPLREAMCDIDDAIHNFRYYASLIKTPHGGVYEVNEGFGKMHSYTVHEPTGVCALITPWNYPLLMGVWKIAPALAAGNSIIYKPSPYCVLTSIKLFEIFDRIGMPKGSVNLLLGGAEVGNTLASSMDVDMITFTGSTKAGQSVMKAAASNVKKIGLELGGKSPNVIFADADLEGAVEWAMIGIFLNQGQICSAGSRILVEKSLHDRFVERLKERAEAITLGNPLNDPDMGPVVNEIQMKRILDYIEIGKKEGATLVTGGYKYEEGECRNGYFIKPTIFDNCTADMTIVKEEIFGPVVVIETFETEQEAIDMANDTPYGLAGAVFTKDGARALRVIKEIRAGITWINCYNPCFNEAPWGGYKMSGIGRELGVHGLEEYQEIKQININLNPGVVGWYKN